MHEELLSCLINMKSNSNLFQLDEAATKQCVILRILRALGWDFNNPDEVTPEYTVENRRVDYSLRLRNENKIFLEVKRAGEELNNEKHEDQLLEYSFRQGVELAVLTNGMTWWLYLPTQRGGWKTRKFFTIDIMEQEIGSVVEHLIRLLAKSNVENGDSLKTAKTIFEGKLKREVVEKTLPEAWYKLINEADSRLIDLVSDSAEKLCGYKPDIEELKKFFESTKKGLLPKGGNGAEETSRKVIQTGDVFTCESKGTSARGKCGRDGFIVMKGSRASFIETKTIPLSAKKQRADLRKKGILKVEDNFYVFVDDYLFNSSSAAASVVLARSANGNVEWKNEKGNMLGQLKGS